MKSIFFCVLVIFFSQHAGSIVAGDFRVMQQTAGPIKTNSYLIYEITSREAALVDPGWKIDSLLQYINDNNLTLKYIFVTHGHIDHFFYAPDLKARYPGAQLCMHKDDYNDMFTAMQWIADNYGKEWIDEANKDPDTKVYMDFDVSLFGAPDIYVENDQTFRLGSLNIKAIHSPGHSPGGICYLAGNIIFSGDVLFYRSVGRTDTQHGSREDQIKSVRKLYELFPDSTIVYPGHGQLTDIGTEKKENKYVTADGGKWDVK